MKLKLAIVALAVSGMLAGTSALARPYYGGGHIHRAMAGISPARTRALAIVAATTRAAPAARNMGATVTWREKAPPA
jgi:hypothetical protein